VQDTNRPTVPTEAEIPPLRQGVLLSKQGSLFVLTLLFLFGRELAATDCCFFVPGLFDWLLGQFSTKEAPEHVSGAPLPKSVHRQIDRFFASCMEPFEPLFMLPRAK
jgi:hypothetical protein